MSVKLDGFLKPYRGKDDLEAFWSKFMVLAKVNKWDNEEVQMSYLPLLLDKAAYTVFDAIPDDDKKSAVKVKEALEKAFGLSAAEAYRHFVNCHMALSESVDN